MILQDGADRKLILPDHGIRRVLIGCDILEDQFDTIKKIIRNRKIRMGIFQTVPSMDEFKLKFNWIKKP